MRNSPVFATLVAVVLVSLQMARASGSDVIDESRIAKAVERALPLLEIASSGSADQRTCFTCHSQALPIFALTEAKRRGFHGRARHVAWVWRSRSARD